MCKHDDGCNAPEGECSGACMKQGETLDQLCERYPAVKALREDNAKAWGMARSTSQLSIDERKMREHIAALESQLAELRQGGEAVAWEVRNGVVHHGIYHTQEAAEEIRFDMQKAHDLSGSIAAFNCRPLFDAPQPAIPPGYVVVPEADPHYVAARILSTLGFAQDVSKEPGADRRRDKIAEMIEECFNTADGGRVRHSISMPEGLHPDTAKLVKRFARALANKLHAAEKKYGYDNGWMRPDWMDECREHLMKHIAKGDPRDVAAYCAFLWHHDASTASAPAIQPQAEAPVDTFLFSRNQLENWANELSLHGVGDVEMAKDIHAMLAAAPSVPVAEKDDQVSKDAARYRWLRDVHEGKSITMHTPVGHRMEITVNCISAALAFKPSENLDFQRTLDATIDAAMLAAAPSVPVAEKWQPIETASAKLLPPTGCAISDRVLIAYDDFDGDEVVGKLVSVGRLRRGGRGDATTEYWDSPSFDEIYEPPTHWMPLPAAPKEQGK